MTEEILRSMQDAIERHSWISSLGVAPTAIIGPIPPGFLDYPCIGVFSPSFDEDGRGLGYADTAEQFSWTLASVLDVSSVETSYLTAVAWIKEARSLARVAYDGSWDVATVESTRVTGGGVNFVEKPAAGGIPLLTIMTLNMEVKYREQA